MALSDQFNRRWYSYRSMNEYVFSIDLSSTPSAVIIGYLQDGELHITESEALDLSPLLPRCGQESADHDSLGGNNSAHAGLLRLRELAAIAEKRLATSIVVAPPPHLLTVNLSVPPAKREERRKAITLLLEDTLPFDPEEYLFDWYALANSRADELRAGEGVPPGRALQDHHIAGAPHLFVRRLIDGCRTASFEPHFIVPPSAALCGALADIPESRSPQILLHTTSQGLCQLLTLSGTPVFQRFIPSCLPSDHQRIARETTALSLWAEQHFGVRARAVYAFGEEKETEKSPADTERLTSPNQTNRSLAELAAIAFLNRKTRVFLTNLRSGPLAINPLVQRAFQHLPSVSLSVLLATGVLALYIFGISVIRGHKIVALQDELFAKISAVIPGGKITPGGEVQALKTENTALNRQLSDLSSAITVSPIDALTTIFRDFPDSNRISLTSLELNGKAVRIKGFSQDYAEIEKLESLLRKRQTKNHKQIYCRIKKELPPSVRSDKVAFRFELRICSVD